ncbi:MAG TPA: ribonuclease HI family protein [Terriglobia bacterium]|nr:ribonuclease HI family protein [Terriglobia bacterium]
MSLQELREKLEIRELAVIDHRNGERPFFTEGRVAPRLWPTNAKIEGWWDGCCEPVNPGGHAAWGALLKVNGEIVMADGRYCGEGSGMSNNVAEYTGVLCLLRKIEELMRDGLRGIIKLRGDSKLCVMQLMGRWRVKQGLYIPIYRKAKDALTQVHELCEGNIRLQWVPREQNSECDVLSKEQLRKRAVCFRIQPEK